MRIRAVRPDFWSDDTLGHLSDAIRLFYIGLWCVADDSGWLEWKPAQLGATLYPYKRVTERERSIIGFGASLVAAGRLVLHPCGCGHIPTLVKHQRTVGNPSYQFRDKHRRHVVDDPSTDKSVLVGTSKPLEVGKVSKVEVGNKRARATADAAAREDWESKVIDMQRRGGT